jgi:adenosylcobinamide-phosphate synthase
MPFSHMQFIETQSLFFYVSVLTAVLIAQFVLGVLLPGQSHRPPLVWWFAQRLMDALGQKLNRSNRSPKALFVRGFLTLGFMLIVGWSMAVLVRNITILLPYGWLGIIVLVWGSVNIITVWRMLRGVTAVENLDDLPRKAGALADLTGLNLKTSDPHTVARAALLYTCRSLSIYVVGPVLALVSFGLVGLMLYVFTLSTGREIDFGIRPKSFFFKPFYMLQALFDLIPSRITAALICLAAIITPTAHPRQALHVVFDGSQHFPGLNFGAPLKAFAGAVGASLGGGLNYQSGAQVVYPWIGHENATARATLADVKRGFVLHIYVTVFVILALLIGLT